MDPIVTLKAFKWLKIRFESSTALLTNVTTFGVAVGATVLKVEVENKDGYQRQTYFYGVVAHVRGVQNNITQFPNSPIQVIYKGSVFCRDFG